MGAESWQNLNLKNKIYSPLKSMGCAKFLSCLALGKCGRREVVAKDDSAKPGWVSVRVSGFETHYIQNLLPLTGERATPNFSSSERKPGPS